MFGEVKSARTGHRWTSLADRASLVFTSTALIVAAVAGLTAWMMWDARREAWTHAIQTAENIAVALDHDIQRNIEVVDLSLQTAVSGLGLPRVKELEPVLRNRILFDGSIAAQHLGAMLVVDAEGKVLIDPRPNAPAEPVDLSDREYFSAHRERPDVGLFISAPFVAKASNARSLALSRRIDDAGGRFAGIAVGTIRLSYFRQLFAGIDMGEGGGIALIHAGGQLILRQPEIAGADRSYSDSRLFEHLARSPAGHFDAQAKIDGVHRLYIYRKIGNLPLILTVSTSVDTVLSGWRPKALIAGIVVAALAVLVALLAWALTRELRRRANAERHARTSEQHFRLMAEHCSDLLVRSRPEDWSRIYVSPASRRLYGYEPEELVGRPLQEVLHPEDGHVVGDANRMLEETGRSLVSYRARRRDGSYVWVEASSTRTSNPETGEAEILSIVRDISDRVRYESELHAAKDAADTASRTKSEFLANMSHEIRTPISGILGMNRLLLGSALDPRQRRYAEMMRDSADSLLTIINDILDVAKLEAGKLELESIDFELPALVESTLALLETKAREKAIELSSTLAPAARGAFRGDPTRLRQILVNLVGNAVKFTERGSVRVEVTESNDPGGTPRLRFAVIDTGCGLDDGAPARLFQKFEQADSSVTRRFGGTGLGLAISRQLAELMGGTIGVESTRGVGSTFWFEVPLAPAVAAVRGTAARRADTPAEIEPTRSLQILLAEDNRVNQVFAVEIIMAAGHRVDIAQNGAEAIEAVARGGYDVVLMDIQMPELDGIEATKRIRRLGRPRCDLPIIALTAHAMSGARDEYLAAGMDDYLSKPIEPAALLSKLADLAHGVKPRAPAAASAAVPLQTLDADRLEMLRATFAAPQLEEFVELFIANAGDRVEQALRCLEAEDFAALGHEAHTIAGVAVNLGAARLGAIARDIETACRAGDPATATRAAGKLRAAADEACAALRLWGGARAA